MNVFHETLKTSNYYKALYPYLMNMSESEIKALPINYFQYNPELNACFHLFHKQHISVLLEVDRRLEELESMSTRLRRGGFKEVLEQIRRPR